jgi:hypothetical protein
MGVAAMLQSPEFEITGDEAKRLADAMQRVARHYSIVQTQLAADWTQLGMMAAAIYGPRLLAQSMKPKAPRPVRAGANGAAPVGPIVGGDVSTGEGPGWADFPMATPEVN